MIKPNDIRQARKRLRVAMRHSHAAAGKQIVAEQLVPFGDRDEAKSFVKISTSFSGGMAKAVLNFRGR